MKINKLSSVAQEGLVTWAKFQHDDDLLFDAIGSIPTEWAWLCFQLRAAEDRPEWFPHGKSATIQAIEAELLREAEQERRKVEASAPSESVSKKDIERDLKTLF